MLDMLIAWKRRVSRKFMFKYLFIYSFIYLFIYLFYLFIYLLKFPLFSWVKGQESLLSIIWDKVVLEKNHDSLSLSLSLSLWRPRVECMSICQYSLENICVYNMNRYLLDINKYIHIYVYIYIYIYIYMKHFLF